MAAVFNAVSRFAADDRYSRIVLGMGANTERFANMSRTSFRKVEQSALRLKKSISGIGSQLKTLVAFGGITGLLLTGAQAITQYDTAIASLQSITGATNEEMVLFQENVNKVARDTKTFSGDIAKSFELVGSAQPELLKNADALAEVTKQTVILGKAGKLGTEDAVRALTVSLNQFGAGADKAAEFTDILATAQQKGSGPITFLAEAMVKAGGISKAFGNNFEDTVAVLEGFAKAGVPASEAGTQYAGIMSKLAKVSQKEFNPQFTKATDIIDNLAKANLSYNELLKLTDAEGAKWITTIVNQNKIVQELAGNLNDTGNAQAQAAINTSTLAERFKQLTDSFKTATAAQTNNSIGLRLFNGVLEFVADNMDTLVGLVAGLAAVLIPLVAIYKTVQAVTWLYNGALAVNALLTGKGAFALKGNILALKAYAGITKIVTLAQWAWNAALTANPIGIIVVAIGAAIAAIAALIVYWNDINAAMAESPGWIQATWNAFKLMGAPLFVLIGLIRRIIDHWDLIKKAFTDGGFLAGLQKLGGVIVSALIDPLVWLLDIAAKLPAFLGGDKFAEWGANVRQFQTTAEGGFGVDERLANEEGGQPEAPINTQATENVIREEQIQRGQLNIDINDPNDRASVDTANTPPGITVKSTQNNF